MGQFGLEAGIVVSHDCYATFRATYASRRRGANRTPRTLGGRSVYLDRVFGKVGKKRRFCRGSSFGVAVDAVSTDLDRATTHGAGRSTHR